MSLNVTELMLLRVVGLGKVHALAVGDCLVEDHEALIIVERVFGCGWDALLVSARQWHTPDSIVLLGLLRRLVVGLVERCNSGVLIRPSFPSHLIFRLPLFDCRPLEVRVSLDVNKLLHVVREVRILQYV